MIQLAQYRLERAKFHALRAVTALDGFDSSKHSGIISYMNREYVKADFIGMTEAAVYNESGECLVK